MSYPSRTVSEADSADPRRARRVWWVVGLLSFAVIAGTVVSGSFGRGKDAVAEKAPRGAVVRTALVVREPLELGAEYRGEVVSEAAELSCQITGLLKEVKVNIGDHFHKGDLLARIDAIHAERQVAEALTQVRAAEAGKKRAKAELATGRAEVARGEKLFEEKLITEQEMTSLRSRVDVLAAESDQAEASREQANARVSVLRAQARDAKLVAPFDGAVAERHLDPGALVQPGKVVLRLVKDGPLRVRFRVPERDIARVKRDMPFEIVTQATGTERFRGKVTRVSAEVSPRDRNTAIEGVVDAETQSLRPGMYATVLLRLGLLEKANVIPGSALVERDVEGARQSGVFLLVDRHAKWKPVSVLGRAGDRTAVSDLSAGTTVLSFGHEALRDGALVRVESEPQP
jgi:RND family efflux transporter MFP subunit